MEYFDKFFLSSFLSFVGGGIDMRYIRGAAAILLVPAFARADVCTNACIVLGVFKPEENV